MGITSYNLWIYVVGNLNTGGYKLLTIDYPVISIVNLTFEDSLYTLSLSQGISSPNVLRLGEDLDVILTSKSNTFFTVGDTAFSTTISISVDIWA
jgi:hypothetical protein